MSGSVVLLHLAGAVALMLYATRMTRTGVERAYGELLRLRLRRVMDRPAMAVLVGAGLALAMQSSTAVTLLVSSFAGSGVVGGLSGQLAVRGAEVGSSLAAKVLTFDLSLVAPAALVVGTTLFMATERRAFRQVGRILVGLGLLLLSLEMIGAASEPLRESRALPGVAAYFAGDPVTAYLIAAVVTWLFHSSIAAILLVATLSRQGLVAPDLGIVLVLGVNLGSSVIAPMLTRAMPPAARVVPIGNLLMRGLGSLGMLGLFLAFHPGLGFLGADAAGRVTNAHLAFNLAILVLGLPLSRLVFAASSRLVALGAPAGPKEALAAPEVSALDEAAIGRPSQALGNATREVVRTCEIVEVMLRGIIELYEDADDERIRALAALDDRLDRKHAAIKLYLAKLDPAALSEAEAARREELLGACIKLEQVGDIIVRNLLALVQKKRKHGLEFTHDGWDELVRFHAAVLATAHMAFNVLVSRDLETARQIVEDKDRLRDLERESSSSHFGRLSEGEARSLETSTIHLDTIRDLKQINSLLAAIAYPVLEERGLLRGSRLRAAR
ncbi:Na/Pi cotransporter family protein [Amaricoccus sp.]|uniref:Na/Pi cotransporter family protein n=1 Tax=Amaricoccus sp. TaxID=1872485 RepID=UPI001B455C7D|nr:Na/Pi cotransporter family protein [Amaricoccus sp.]MBP7001075.1 Na/Pi cotransporter family protein [Amaricoccus sp.]